MGFNSVKYISFKKRSLRVHSKCRAASHRFRLSLFRSNRHMSVQLIDDSLGFTVYSVSTMNKDLRERFCRKFNKSVVLQLADFFVEHLPVELLNSKIVFDKGGYTYAGNIKLFADAIRGHLKF